MEPQHILPKGTTLNNGEFRIEQKLDQGGFGITYIATQIDDLRGEEDTVVIKEFFMSGCYRQGSSITSGTLTAQDFEKFKESFLDEARTLYKFRTHPNIVNVRKFFRENGTAYFVMDFVGGGDMEKYTREQPNNRLSMPQTLDLLRQIGGALIALHAANIIHRDLKPQNILRTTEGDEYVLIDFGIAREYISDKTVQTSKVIQTPGYAPPEQYDRDTKRGAFTDVYALGATAYRLLTGVKPPDAVSRLNDDLVPPRELASNITEKQEAAIMKSMALRSRDRYQTVAAFLADMDPTNEGTVVSFTPSDATQVSFTPVSDATQVVSSRPPIDEGATQVSSGPARTPEQKPKPEPKPKQEPKPQKAKAEPKEEAKKGSKAPIWIGIGLVLALAAGAAYFLTLPSEEENAWKDAEKANTEVAYQDFLTKYPEGEFAPKAKDKSREIFVADSTAKANSAAEEEKKRLAEAEQKRVADSLAMAQNAQLKAQDEAAWKSAVSKSTKASYQQYLTAQANGLHRPEAQAAVDRFNKAEVEAKQRAEEAKKFNYETVYVQGGTFSMGCTREQGDDCYDDESPAHQVTVSGYSIGKYEVTQAQWKFIMDGNNPSKFKCDNCPVESVSWNDVQTFISKVNQLTGQNYRLPTEAEWEFAARGGSRSLGYKYAGSNSPSEIAWFDSNKNKNVKPVGQKRPNELGIYDMSGNVLEWCSDTKNTYTSSPQTNPRFTRGTHHVNRGGNWYAYERSLRVSGRNYNEASYKDERLGFRLVK